MENVFKTMHSGFSYRTENTETKKSQIIHMAQKFGTAMSGNEPAKISSTIRNREVLSWKWM
jgi:hypothetical protein